MLDLDTLDFAKRDGVVTIVTIDDATGRVLMVASADREALEQAMATGEMHYRSRTRGLWRKGATSGNVQHVIGLAPDCDGDAVIARVRPDGPACHTGATSCFADEAAGVLSRLAATIAARASAPGDGYTRRLLGDRNLRLKKIGEEAAELVHAAAIVDRERVVEEAADLIYHTLVVLQSVGAGLDDLCRTLADRGALVIPSEARNPHVAESADPSLRSG
jgi:phosphoribosyl-AMP cyclohydrolase / phosphoribosyl-ATP pyrophosphohydrolase